MSSTVGEGLGVSTLLYLFAAGLVPKGSRFVAGIPTAEVPCSQEKVRQDAFAQLLWASAFWSLHDQGLIRLRLEREPDTTTTGTAQAAPGPRVDLPGLEGAIVRALHGPPVAEKRARFVVFSWFTGPVKDPYGATIDAVAQAAAGAGYLEAVIRGGRVKRVRPNCDLIATLRPAFDEAAGRWAEFGRAEPDLDRALLEGIAVGLTERSVKKPPQKFDFLDWYQSHGDQLHGD